MARWLFKQEPGCYGFSDLERDGKTAWDGVTNALALIHLRKVKAGDQILMYHTGKEKAVVGEMKAISANEGEVAVAPVRRLKRPVALAELKARKELASWELIRNSRLSVMPVSDRQWQLIQELAESEPN
jgi:predicted RNA-binding protein with PUA-like domain